MTRLRALNETSSDDSEEENEERETIEAQEERAFSLYKKALEFRQKEKYSEAEELLIALLNDDFLANVCSEDQPSGADGLVRPAVALKYACLKNLGNVLVLQKRPEDGLKCFIQAVELDESDVTMWHQMGNLALQIDDFQLASQAFQEGLRCNAHHWPCLDSLLPVLYALNDYLGCLLLASRALDLDPEYPQALALRDQIFKEDPSLCNNFKKFFPDEIDIAGFDFNLEDEAASKAIAQALSLQESYKIKSAFHSDITVDLECNRVISKLFRHSWEELGRSIIQTYNAVNDSLEKSFLNPVEITLSESSNVADTEERKKQSTTSDCGLAQRVVDIENEAVDADSEQDAKGEDQTEEDATEASGLEEEVKSTKNPPQSSPGLKRKRKRTSTNLMDQWSKRRSGRRSGRKAEDREESNLASRFRSFLPETLLSKDLEAEIAKASKRRALRDPVDDWGDGSMDTAELCHLLQERDAKDEHQRKLKQNSRETLPERLNRENYFGTSKERSDVCLFLEQYCSGSHNIIQLITNFTKLLAGKSSQTWPSGLVAVYTEAYECMRKHVPFYSPFNGLESADFELTDLYASLLYCELLVDVWQQRSLNNQDILNEDGCVLAEALGNVMLLAGLNHIFSSTSEQSIVMVRIHWLRVNLSLLQENSSSAIHSLQEVLESLEMIEAEERLQDNELANKPEKTVNNDSTQIDDVKLEPSTNSIEGNFAKSNEEKSLASSHNKSTLEDTLNCPITEDVTDKEMLSDLLPSNQIEETGSSAHIKLDSLVASCDKSLSLVGKENEGICLTLSTNNEEKDAPMDICTESGEGIVSPPFHYPSSKEGNVIDECSQEQKSVERESSIDIGAEDPQTLKLGDVEGETPAEAQQSVDGSDFTIETKASGPVAAENNSLASETSEVTRTLTEKPQSKQNLKDCGSIDLEEVVPQSKQVLKECGSISMNEEIKQDEVICDVASTPETGQIKGEILEEQCALPEIADQIMEIKESGKELSNSETAEVASADKSIGNLSNERNSAEPSAQCLEGKADLHALHASCSEQGKTTVSSDLDCAGNVSIIQNLEERSAIKSPVSLKDDSAPTTDDLTTESKTENITEDNVIRKDICPTISTVNNISIGVNAVKNHTDTPMSTANKGTGVEEEKSSDSSATTKAKCQIKLPNCSVNQDINKRAAQKLLMSLTRQQQLSEVDDLYSSGQYEILASSLTECFKYCAQQTDCENPEIDNLPDRPTQMAMLLDSLWQLQRYSDCFYWTEACLHEAFNRYLSSSDSENASQDHDDQQMWATTVERLLAGLNGCFKVSNLKILEKQPKICLTRLVQNLTSILCQQLEQNECSMEMAIECTTPWVILHKVVLFEEQQLPSCKDCIPSYMSVLFTAHEYMGKKALCWLNEGVLLHLILDVVVPQLRSAEFSSVRDDLIREAEQAILCLYGHPKKPVDRCKKRLQDHRVHQQLDLTWDRSLMLLKFFEPDELPCFDSNPTTKISPDEEQLFLRILNLVPFDCSPKRFTEKMKAYLEGSVEAFPDIYCPIPQAAQNLYYLLADYYLKTFKWDAAIRFYMLDVCINPHRFDSWAGMALARSTQMFHDINSCDTLNKERQLCRKRKAQKCFQLAVDLDPENTVMLIEYGNFAYTMHSFCSRLLKTETDGLSMEMFTKIEEEKDKMLAITEKCFKAAEKLDQDERWLQQFMLGKVAEKRGEGPLIFLKHYRQAARLLFESKAEYPLSLNYDPPQHYAFEAHEVHYRLHASILKGLEQMEGKILSDEIESLYKETLDEAAISPFMAIRTSQLSLVTKRVSLDPLEHVGKKMRLDDSVGVIVVDSEDCKVIKSDVKGSSLQSEESTSESRALKTEAMKEGADADMHLSSSLKTASPITSSNHKLNDVANSNSGAFCASKENLDSEDKRGSSNATHQSAIVKSDEISVGPNVPSISCMEKNDKDPSEADVNLVSTDEKNKDTEGDSVKKLFEVNTQEADSFKKKDSCEVSTYKKNSPSSSSATSSSDDSGSESENFKSDRRETKEKTVLQDLSNNDTSTTAPTVNKVFAVPSCPRSADHTDLINQCLFGIEECLVRYPRHYKSLYRLCHYYFHSKRNRNLKKCHQLLLSDYRVLRANKNTNINGLFKSGSVNTMFNDVWRMPIDEIDRAGSFASHMSRCVHLLMELLRAQRDHGMLLKLSVFLKRDPEKKDKKYLRDNERADLSKQALVLCLAAMRENGNTIRATDSVIELFRTVKDGIKEMPHKEGIFKTLLSDAYKKFKGLTQVEHSLYDDAVNFCQSELNHRKTIADSKLKQAQERAQLQAQALQQMQAQVQAQVQAQAQAQAQAQVQAQVQAQAQAMQMGVNASALPFNPLQTRFPTGVNTSLGNALASSMFLPQMPVYRGRGRPPKVQQQAQQRLHNAMMMAQMIGLANTANSVSISSDALKPKMKQQRRVQQPTTSGPSTVVSSIIKERPALSITTLPNSSSATTTSSTNSGSSAGADSLYPQQSLSTVRSGSSAMDILPSGQSVWQARPRNTFPRPMNTPLPGNTDPRSNLNSSVRREGPRPKLGNNSGPQSFQPQTGKSFGNTSQSSNPVSLLSRLPGLQVKQNPQQTFGVYSETQNKAPTPQERAPATAQQQLDRLQKLHMANSQSTKPAVSISKVSKTSPAVDINFADRSETKKNSDPNDDIIVLD